MRFDITDTELKIIEGIVTQKLVFGVETEHLAKTLRQLRDTMVNMYGPTVTAILFYHLGRVEAERVFNIAKDLKLNVDFEKLLWINGSIEKLQIEKEGKLLKIKVINNIDDTADMIIIEGEGCGAGCYYIRGYIEKLVELIYNTNIVYIKEIACRFRGKDYCQYHVLIR